MSVEEAGQVISAPELTHWMAWEREFGPLLVGDRIDYGLAQVAYVVARTGGAQQVNFRDFLPEWLRDQAGEASVLRGFERLRLMALAREQGIEGATGT